MTNVFETMTDKADAAVSAPARTAWQAVHRDAAFVAHHLAAITAAVSHVLPIAERVVTSPVLDELLETALRADELGVAAEVITAVTGALRQAIDDRQASGPQPVTPLQTDVPSMAPPPPVAPEVAAHVEATMPGSPDGAHTAITVLPPVNGDHDQAEATTA